MIRQQLRQRPFTATIIAALGLWMAWTGGVILIRSRHLPPARLEGYAGPRALFSLTVWGWLFLGGAAVLFIRIACLRWPRVDIALHMLSMWVIVLWMICFDFNQMSTGQPAYTFIALVCLLSPYITRIMYWAVRRNDVDDESEHPPPVW